MPMPCIDIAPSGANVGENEQVNVDPLGLNDTVVEGRIDCSVKVVQPVTLPEV